MNDHNELRPIRCTRCGRFLGYEAIAEGSVVLKCAKCKNWTVVKAEGSLTNIEQIDILKEREEVMDMENNSSDFDLVKQAEDVANRYWHYRETHCTARKYVQDAIRLLEMALEQCETCPHKGNVLSEVIGGCLANFKGPSE